MQQLPDPQYLQFGTPFPAALQFAALDCKLWIHRSRIADRSRPTAQRNPHYYFEAQYRFFQKIFSLLQNIIERKRESKRIKV